MPVIKDIFAQGVQGISYSDVFGPRTGIIIDPGTGVTINDAILGENGELLLTEDGLYYLALEAPIS